MALIGLFTLNGDFTLAGLFALNGDLALAGELTDGGVFGLNGLATDTGDCMLTAETVERVEITVLAVIALFGSVSDGLTDAVGATVGVAVASAASFTAGARGCSTGRWSATAANAPVTAMPVPIAPSAPETIHLRAFMRFNPSKFSLLPVSEIRLRTPIHENARFT